MGGARGMILTTRLNERRPRPGVRVNLRWRGGCFFRWSVPDPLNSPKLVKCSKSLEKKASSRPEALKGKARWGSKRQP